MLSRGQLPGVPSGRTGTCCSESMSQHRAVAGSRLLEQAPSGESPRCSRVPARSGEPTEWIPIRAGAARGIGGRPTGLTRRNPVPAFQHHYPPEHTFAQPSGRSHLLDSVFDSDGGAAQPGQTTPAARPMTAHLGTSVPTTPGGTGCRMETVEVATGRCASTPSVSSALGPQRS